MAKKRILRTKELFEETEEVAAALAEQPEAVPRQIPIVRLVPSRFNSRQTYPREAQAELTQSMRQHGFIGALDGRELPDGRVELAYGSRRLLAAAAAGLREIPVALHDWDDAQMCFVSLVENLAREDLSADDEAAMLGELRDRFELALEEIGQGVGKPASWVDDRVRAADSAGGLEGDTQAAALDEIVASLVASQTQRPDGAPVYMQDVPFDDALGALQRPSDAAAGGAVGRERLGVGAPQVSGSPWVATGSPMLVLAMEYLKGFRPATLSDGEVDEALRLLDQLRDRVAALSRDLRERRRSEGGRL